MNSNWHDEGELRKFLQKDEWKSLLEKVNNFYSNGANSRGGNQLLSLIFIHLNIYSSTVAIPYFQKYINCFITCWMTNYLNKKVSLPISSSDGKQKKFLNRQKFFCLNLSQNVTYKILFAKENFVKFISNFLPSFKSVIGCIKENSNFIWSLFSLMACWYWWRMKILYRRSFV